MLLVVRLRSRIVWSQSDRSSKGQISVCYYGCCYASLSPTYYAAQCGPSTLSLPISQPVYVACPQRVWLETLLRNCSIYSLGARSHQVLNSSKTVNCAPQQLSNQRVHLDHPWRSLAQLLQSSRWPIPVFKSAKELRDGVKLVCYPPHPLHPLRTLMIILYPCSQVASEKAELYSQNTKRYQPQGTRRRLRLQLRAHCPYKHMRLDHPSLWNGNAASERLRSHQRPLLPKVSESTLVYHSLDVLSRECD